MYKIIVDGRDPMLFETSQVMQLNYIRCILQIPLHFTESQSLLHVVTIQSFSDKWVKPGFH